MATLIRRSLQGRLNEAAAVHDRGELLEAARRYEAILREAPEAWQPAFLLGLLRFQEQDVERAETLFRRVVRLNERHAEAWYYLGELLAQTGREAEAEAAYRLAAAQEPPHPMASFRLGLMTQARGEAAAAEAAYRRALRGRPEFPEALNNLANLLRASKGEIEAEACLRHAIALRRDFAPAYINLAALLTDRGSLDLACDALRAGVEACPANAQLHFHFGAALAAAGRGAAAVSEYERTLALEPGHADAHNNVGLLFLEQGFLYEARICFERAIGHNANLVEAHNNLGNVLMRLECYGEACAAFEHAVALQPTFSPAYNGLGMVFVEMGKIEAGIDAFRAALEGKPVFADAEANLGAALRGIGQVEEARACYARAIQLNGSVALRIKAALALPPIPGSREALLAARRRVEADIDELTEAGWRTDEADLLKYPETAFYLAYHGMNDRPILEKLARLYGTACPSLSYRAPGAARSQPARHPIRLGFVSRFLYAHSVGHFFNPIIEHLARRPEFDVSLFTVGYRRDAALDRVAAACRKHVALSPHSLPPARNAIEDADLDVLIYTDVGMDPFTYFLSFSRLAPAQCVLHGHSDTSGVPELDWFVSSRLLEPDDAQAQYSETLALLDTLPMVLRDLPTLPRIPSRAELGLPLAGRLYICPMKLHKVHPDMDPLIASILRSDADARVLLFEDDRCRRWHQTLRARIEPLVGDDIERVEFLPFVGDEQRFRAVLAHAAVVLDTPHHGGGTTCNLAFSVGAPVVSLVGETCRGRGPLAYYTLMGLDQGIAHTPEQYVEKALHIGGDPAFRSELSREILERRSRFAQNAAVLEAYVDLFREPASSGVRGRR